LPYNSNTL